MTIAVLIAGLDRSPRRGTLAIVETVDGRSTCAFELDEAGGVDPAPCSRSHLLWCEGE
jgi:hypothetical protein